MKVDFLPWYAQPSSFTELSRRRRHKMRDNVCEGLETVGQKLAGRLTLPRKIRIGFVDNTRICAEASSTRVISVSTSFAEQVLRGGPVLEGVLAHELSHESDFYTRNSRQRSQTRPLVGIVEEGKAEQVGAAIGGEAYRNYFRLHRLPEDTRRNIYGHLFDEQPLKVERGIVRTIARFIDPPRSSWSEGMGRPEYIVGYNFTADATAQAGATDIFAIHSMPHTEIIALTEDYWHGMHERSPEEVGSLRFLYNAFLSAAGRTAANSR